MQHRPQVLTTGAFTHVPACSCGWIGDDQQNTTAARAVANTHVVTALRKAAATAVDPRQAEIPGTGARRPGAVT